MSFGYAASILGAASLMTACESQLGFRKTVSILVLVLAFSLWTSDENTFIVRDVGFVPCGS